MKKIFVLLGALLIASGVFAAQPVRVLLVLGGHGFDKEPFFEMIGSLPGVTVETVWHPESYAYFEPGNRGRYDIILQYDMNKGMPEQARRDYIETIRGGKGLIALHHSYCGNEDFPEYRKIIGGQYFHTVWQDEKGASHPAGAYEHDVVLSVGVLDGKHPVTRGVSDFKIVDEVYRNGYVASDVTPLLSANDAGCPLVGWTKPYGKARVVTLLLGHDNQAWSNESFLKLLNNAIGYCAGK